MELLSNLNSGAKIVLKVELCGSCSTNIQLVSINKDYVKKENSNDFKYYKNEIYDFVLWSTQDFIFDNRQLRLPDEKNIKKVMSHTHIFSNDKERYAALKKLYNTLGEWAKTIDISNGIVSSNWKKIILAGEYWFVS